ncbi:dihydroorotate dehydrogenase electron transfer subunit, partial [Atopobiaceae bacterium LCP21S3_F7]
MTPESKARAFDYVVREVAPVAEGVHRMVMGVPAELAGALAPGMFVNVEVPHNPAHLTRVPLSFASADAAAGELELVFAAVGDATRRLAALRPGEGATVLGPLGNGWWLPEGAGAGSRVVVVAGGVGLPPVVAAARMARSARCAV